MKKIRDWSICCLLLCGVLLAGCAAGNASGWMEYKVFCGMSSKDGEISEAAWKRFCDKHVSAAFPDGYTVLDATGYWRSGSDIAEKERSKVILVIAPAEAKEKAMASGDTAKIDEATIKYDNLAESLQGAKMHLINLEQEQENAKQGFNGDPTQNLRTQLRQLTVEIATLTLEYRNMSDDEKKSAAGRELQSKLELLTKKAGDLRDAMDDVTRAIRATASDTKNFDALAGGINVVTSSFGAVTGAD